MLGGRLMDSCAGLPEHERPAAVEAVRDAFAAAGELTADRLFAMDLDPERLAAELPPPAAGLSERAAGLYGELLGRCCVHVVEQLTAEPSFAARAAVEQARAAQRTRELVEDVRNGSARARTRQPWTSSGGTRSSWPRRTAGWACSGWRSGGRRPSGRWRRPASAFRSAVMVPGRTGWNTRPR
ncbi:NACHT N-terminal Helical domain 1-containing protein [Streptomyces sp. NBC_00376]|uniref:NACHT N-terminal Helical domain 1-containing protein n=1 Tax=Streptomyces sp. NBC_00376 TaxID=2975730 RepID=UPI002E1D3143